MKNPKKQKKTIDTIDTIDNKSLPYVQEKYVHIELRGYDELKREVSKEFILSELELTINGHCKFF